MKGMKKVLMCCVSYSLITSNELIAAPNAISKLSSNIGATAANVTQVVRASSGTLRRLGVYSGLMPVSFPQTSQRSYTTYKGSGEGTSNSMQGNIPGNNIADMIRQTELLLRTLQQQTEALNQGSVPAQAVPTQAVPPKTGFQSAVITPLNSFVPQAEKAVVPQVTKVSNQIQATHEFQDQDQDQTSLNIIKQKREELVNRLMACVKVANKTTQEHILAIVDLYGALPHRPKEGITDVLTGEVNTPRSGIYSNIKRYTESQGSTLDVFRNIYARLSESFGEEAVAVIFRVADDMMKENPYSIKSFIKENGKRMGRKDLILYLVQSAHPLYPVSANEIEMILGVYGALPHRSKEGITNVLSGRIKTPKSGIYSNIIRYLDSAEIDLGIVRNTFDRLGESADGDILNIINILLDESQ